MKKLKSVLTAIAFIFAVAGAFAFNTAEDDSLATVRWNSGSGCPIRSDCKTEVTTTACSVTTFADTGCSVKVTSYYHPE